MAKAPPAKGGLRRGSVVPVMGLATQGTTGGGSAADACFHNAALAGERGATAPLDTAFDCILSTASASVEDKHWATGERLCRGNAVSNLRLRKRVDSRPGVAGDGRTGEGRQAAHALEKSVGSRASAA